MSYLTNNLSKMSTSKNSYSNDKRLQEKGYIIYGDGNLNKSIHNETSLLKDKESVEREPVYAGTISAGSGSVSSTKIKKELEGKRKKKFKKIEYLNKTKVVTSSINQATMKMGLQNSSYPGGIKKNSYTQYQKKYKFKPTQAISSSRDGTITKPPLGTINATLPANGITYKNGSRSRADQFNQNRENNSCGSFRSSGEPTHDNLRLSSGINQPILKSGKLNSNSIDSQDNRVSTTKNYSNEIKRDVASKLSATLPKSSAYRKYGNDSSFKESPVQKTGIGHKIQIYTNSINDYEMDTSGINTGKYAKIPKNALKPSLSQEKNTDGSVMNIRSLECNTSPFRTDNNSSSSFNRPFSGLKTYDSKSNSSRGPRPISGRQ